MATVFVPVVQVGEYLYSLCGTSRCVDGDLFESFKRAQEYIPVTLITQNSDGFSSVDLERKGGLFAYEDDVWSPEFMSCVSSFWPRKVPVSVETLTTFRRPSSQCMPVGPDN